MSCKVEVKSVALIKAILTNIPVHKVLVNSLLIRSNSKCHKESGQVSSSSP